MQLPTNYKMGTGLAATIMGSQAGLEQEKMGLENLYKGMQMPGEILKGEEQAMLLQDPKYLQQKTANTMIELGNQYDAGQIQQTLNAFGRVKLQLQAAAGDPQKTQQIVMDNLQQMGVDPNSDFGRAALSNPEQTIDRMIQGAEASLARSGGAKQAGAKELTMIKEQGDTERADADRAMRLRIAQLQEGGANARSNNALSSDKMLAEMITKANAGDPAAQQWIKTYSQVLRFKNPGFASPTLTPSGQLGTKGDVGGITFGNEQPTQPKSYNYVPGKGLVAQ